MAGIKISALPAAPSAQLTDVFPIDGLPGPVTYKLANSQLLSLFQANMVASITGTPNQVIASSPTGAVTLSLPQSIATTSSPQFAAVKTPTILDSNGNIMLQFTTAPSAVNYIDITNSATGGGGTFFAKGTDPNINMGFITQGTGSFFLDSANTTTPLVINSGTTLQHTTNLIFADTANTRNITFPDASGTLSLTSGTVSSVSGTSNRITSTGGTTPVIDIAATYVGQSSITTLGTIGTGTWQGSVIGGTYGGTGVNNGASTITLGGSLTTSGAFASTFTMTGITNVTFPTSGTLSTTTGTVTSVSGTSNRITSTGGTTPVIDISASYVGQTSITTLGTITSGTWTGTTIAVANGGTGITSFGTGVATALGQNVTGSGGIVLATSPTVATPKIAQINDANGNAIFTMTPTASAVNNWSINNNSIGLPVIMAPIGTDSNIGMIFQTKGTGIFVIDSANTTTPVIINSGTTLQHTTNFAIADTAQNRTVTIPDATGTMLMTGQAINTVPSIAFSSTSGIIGTTTNNNAASLSVGEVISSNVTVNTTSLTSGTIADTTSISLTAGDWDVYGTVGFFGNAATTPTFLKGWCSTTSATDPGSPNISTIFPTGVPFATAPLNFSVPFLRVSIASTTTVYLSVQAIFGTSTCTSGGQIVARRAR